MGRASRLKDRRQQDRLAERIEAGEFDAPVEEERSLAGRWRAGAKGAAWALVLVAMNLGASDSAPSSPLTILIVLATALAVGALAGDFLYMRGPASRDEPKRVLLTWLAVGELSGLTFLSVLYELGVLPTFWLFALPLALFGIPIGTYYGWLNWKWHNGID